MSSEQLHAPRERLSAKTISMHQAIVSLMEELEAADWYRQRADDCEDAALKQVLLHNMREEIEHVREGVHGARSTINLSICDTNASTASIPRVNSRFSKCSATSLQVLSAPAAISLSPVDWGIAPPKY